MKVFYFKDNDGYSEYRLVEGSTFVKILFARNQDLYWIFDDINLDCGVRHGTFNITKENPFIYKLFDNLYNQIKSANPFDYMVDHGFNPVGWVSRDTIDYEKYDMYKELFDGTRITWVSDDNDYDHYNIVTITPNEETYILDFYKEPKKNKEGLCPYRSGSVTIRFRNSGSYYRPFNNVFMKMYQDLGGYSSEYGQMPYKNPGEIPGQMHIEEYVYSLKR